MRDIDFEIIELFKALTCEERKEVMAFLETAKDPANQTGSQHEVLDMH